MISSRFNLSQRKIAAGTTLIVGAGSLLMGCRPMANQEQPNQSPNLANVEQLRSDPNFRQSEADANRAEGGKRVRCTEGSVVLVEGGKLVVKAAVSPVPHGAELEVQLESSYGRSIGYTDGAQTGEGIEAEVADPNIAEGAYGRQTVTVVYPTGLDSKPMGKAVCPPGNIVTP